jgi:hypothetical protein
VVVSALVTGGDGLQGRWVSDGTQGDFLPIEGDAVTFELDVAAPDSGASRYRFEVWEGATPVTFTSHLWVEPGEGVLEPGTVDASGGGCALHGASSAGRVIPALLLSAVVVFLSALLRRRASRRDEE